MAVGVMEFASRHPLNNHSAPRGPKTAKICRARPPPATAPPDREPPRLLVLHAWDATLDGEEALTPVRPRSGWTARSTTASASPRSTRTCSPGQHAIAEPGALSEYGLAAGHSTHVTLSTPSPRWRGEDVVEIRPLGWEDVRELPAGWVIEREIDGDSRPGGPIRRTIRYVAPFDRCSREDDYALAWAAFAARRAYDP